MIFFLKVEIILKLVGSIRGDKRWLDFVYFMGLELIDFLIDQIRFVRKKIVKDDIKFLGLIEKMKSLVLCYFKFFSIYFNSDGEQ